MEQDRDKAEAHGAEDSALAALITREQKGFRSTLMAGVAAALIMTLASAALGAYLWTANERLSRTIGDLESQAFGLRRAIDAQRNQVVAQERALRHYYAEIRGEEPKAGAGPGEALRRFLEIGAVPSLADQRAIGQMARAPALAPAERALFAGADGLIEFQWRNEAIGREDADLPARLKMAQAAFATAAADPAFATLAAAGKAQILYLDASSARRNYSNESCAAVYQAVEASADKGAPPPLPLYWRAQCERKTGRTGAALADYARALDQSAPALAPSADAGDAAATPDEATTLAAMNAFHGLGTTLIAGALLPADSPELSEGLAIAARHCGKPDEGRSERMGLAVACLHQAMNLRRALGQTPNQISGSAENIGFALLRDRDYNGAFAHASTVERSGLFAWNETVRALSAQAAGAGAASARAAAARQAQLNLSFFTVAEFNLCEIRALLSDKNYAAARRLIAAAHPGEKVECRADGA